MGSGAWRSLSRVWASKDGCGRDPGPGHGGQDLVKEGGPSARVSTWVATSARWARGALSLASILVLPARFRSAGVGQAAMTSRMASCARPGPHHGLEGWAGSG